MTTRTGADDVRPPLSGSAGDVSSRIDFLRLVLILGIMIIHIPYTARYEPYAGTGGALEHVIIYLRDGIFRAGVPALSVISGFLLARQVSRPYGELLRKKMGTLLIPFLIFNLGTFVAVYAMQAVGGGNFWPNVVHAGFADQMDFALGLTDDPINVPLYFLRDMVVCMLFAPLLFWGAQRAMWPTLAFLVFMVVFGRQVPVWGPIQDLVIFRPSIPLFLFVGLILGLRRADLTRLDGHAGFSALVCLAGGVVTMQAMAPGDALPQSAQFAITLVAQVAICVAVWVLSASLVRLPLGQLVARNGSKAFWLFCTHAPALTILFMLWMKTDIPYPVFYVLAVPMTATILLSLHAVLRAVMPGVMSFVLGARTAKAKARQTEGLARPA